MPRSCSGWQGRPGELLRKGRRGLPRRLRDGGSGRADGHPRHVRLHERRELLGGDIPRVHARQVQGPACARRGRLGRPRWADRHASHPQLALAVSRRNPFACPCAAAPTAADAQRAASSSPRSRRGPSERRARPRAEPASPTPRAVSSLGRHSSDRTRPVAGLDREHRGRRARKPRRLHLCRRGSHPSRLGDRESRPGARCAPCLGSDGAFPFFLSLAPLSPDPPSRAFAAEHTVGALLRGAFALAHGSNRAVAGSCGGSLGSSCSRSPAVR